MLDWVFPPTCLSCGGLILDNHGVCPSCWGKLTFITSPFCRVCGHPLASDMGEAITCARCLYHPPKWHCARSPLCYDEFSRPMILRFKHADRLNGCTLFARWLMQYGGDCLKDADGLIPVPLHWWRLWRRRYNQSAELARFISKASGIPLWSGVLRRKRATPPQGSFNIKERRKNVRGAFHIPAKEAKIIRGKRVVLIDDVMTTGATTEECARILLQIGAKQVNLLSLARVVLGSP